VDRQSRLGQIKSQPWLAEICAGIVSFIYLAQLWFHIHTQVSNLDEGNYLYKGYLFATGQYWPFQDYGPRTNHMPLSFLIPGFIQKWFGPGLRSGRYLAWFLGLLFIIGVWLLLKRIGGRWWAVFGILVLALNPAGIKMNSVMASQVQINVLLVWTLVFALGGNRSTGQIIFGSVLAAVALLTRLNLAPLLPLLLLYIWWEYGGRTFGLAVLASGMIVVVGHLIFWPGILRMWASWLPIGLTPFLNEYRAPGGILLWDPGSNFFKTLLSLFTGIRFQFSAFIGFVFSVLLFPKKESWPTSAKFRAAVFLVVLFTVLLAAHTYVTLNWTRSANSYYSSSYCVFCFPAYISFFAILGLILLILTWPLWSQKIFVRNQIILVISILLLTTGMGFGAFENIGKPLAEMSIPWISGGKLVFGEVTIWGLLNNKFGWTVAQTRKVVPAVAGFLIGIMILGGAVILKIKPISHRLGIQSHSFGWIVVSSFVVTSVVLTPTTLLGGGSHVSDCQADVIQSYENLGTELSANIPSESRVYWTGILSPSALLYLPSIEIYPAQLNADYAFYSEINGTEDDHLKHGSWNQTLADQWIQETDIVLIGHGFEGWYADILSNQADFEYLGITAPIVPCKPNQQIRIFQRLPKP
jgi:hypothetical protein